MAPGGLIVLVLDPDGVFCGALFDVFTSTCSLIADAHDRIAGGCCVECCAAWR
jgi:hypothetical protein